MSRPFGRCSIGRSSCSSNSFRFSSGPGHPDCPATQVERRLRMTRSSPFLVLIALGAVQGCKREDKQAVTADAITIGVVLPLTGREAKPGQYQKEGVDLAIKQINQAGGVMVKAAGKKLPLKEIFYDDGSDQAKSASFVERTMSSDNATAVIGGYSTALGEAESVMPDRYKVPWITPGAAASAIFNRGYQWAFGMLTPTDILGSTTAEFLQSVVEAGTVPKRLNLALALENTHHGIEYSKGIKQWVQKTPASLHALFI